MADRLSANTQTGPGAQFVERIDAKFRPCPENVLRRAVCRAEIYQFIDVIFHAGRAEYGVGDKARADIGKGQTVRLGVVIEVIGCFSAAASGHELRDDCWLAGKIFPQERNRGLCPQCSGAARFASLNQHDCFALEVRCRLR